MLGRCSLLVKNCRIIAINVVITQLIPSDNDESRVCSKSALVQDANVKKVISEQTTQWSSMVERQRKEEWEMLKSHTEAGREEFKKLIEIVQASQVKQLQAKHDKYANYHFSSS